MMRTGASSRSQARPARLSRHCGGRCSIGTAVAASRAATAAFARLTTSATGLRAAPPRSRTSFLLCRRHHRAVHEEGYQVDRQPDGELRFRRPDGRVIPNVPCPSGGAGRPGRNRQNRQRRGRGRREHMDRNAGLAGRAARRRLRHRRAASLSAVERATGQDSVPVALPSPEHLNSQPLGDELPPGLGGLSRFSFSTS